MYVAQAAAMGFVGAAAGAALGVGIQFTLPRWSSGFPSGRRQRDARTGARSLTGLGIGVWVALVFALRPLLAHPPRLAAAPRCGATPRRMGTARRGCARLDVVTTALALSSGCARVCARRTARGEGFVFTAGIGASLGVLGASAWALIVLARRSSRRGGHMWCARASPTCTGRRTRRRSVVLALGFGAFLVSTLYLVQANLLQQFDATAVRRKANVLFFDVQEDQRAGSTR